MGYNMIIRAEGRMKTAAIMMGIGLLINVMANYLFMVIFDFGVEGAAWGTNIGMFIYVFFFYYDNYDCYPRNYNYESFKNIRNDFRLSILWSSIPTL